LDAKTDQQAAQLLAAAGQDFAERAKNYGTCQTAAIKLELV